MLVYILMILVFQAELNVLGMAIYGTELALWTGVFICGGYFHLTPWVRAKISRRKQEAEIRGPAQAQHDESGTITLHQMPSSTSVFRTPSATLVERSSGLLK